MKHPLILVVPALMLLDYVLTILGAKASLGVYQQHFVSPHYELNPNWQKSVQQLRWFNPRHFILVCVVTAILILLDQMQELPFRSFDLAMGMLIGTYGSVCGRHLSNLLFFRYLNSHPTEITGQVRLNHSMVLHMSVSNYFGLVPFIGLLVILEPEPQMIGALLGVFAITYAHYAWGRKAKREDGQSKIPATPESRIFMILEKFRNGDAVPVYQRFRDQGRMAPAGLTYVTSWVRSDLTMCYQVMETTKRELIDEWIGRWSDLVDFEVVPVMTSAEAVVAMNERSFQPGGSR